MLRMRSRHLRESLLDASAESLHYHDLLSSYEANGGVTTCVDLPDPVVTNGRRVLVRLSSRDVRSTGMLPCIGV